MIIGIDGNEANIKSRVGVNVYAYELLWGIFRNILQDKLLRDKLSVKVFLKQKPLSDLPPDKPFWKYVILPDRPFWILSTLMPYFWTSRDRPEVLLSPSHYTIPFSSTPRLISIMDLGYLESSEQFKKMTYWQLKYWTAISINISKYIFAISKSTKNEIIRYYPKVKDKIVVTPLAYDKTKFNTNISPQSIKKVMNKYSIVNDYILSIGTLKPNKNIEGVIHAFSLLSKRFKYDLVISGKKGWMFEKIFEKVKSKNLTNKVVFTDFVDEDDKPALMAGAKVLVSPSFWEGFGLHALEAMAVGTPVIVSDRGSFPEVVGKAGLIVNPKSVEEISAAIEKVLKMRSQEYNKLVDLGLDRVKEFSWEKTARLTLDTILRLK